MLYSLLNKRLLYKLDWECFVYLEDEYTVYTCKLRQSTWFDSATEFACGVIKAAAGFGFGRVMPALSAAMDFTL